MSINIDSMTDKYTDFMRNYLFYCKVIAGPIPALVGSDHPYLVTSANLPTTTIGQAEATFQGNVYRVGTTTEFEDYTITFRADNAQSLRSQFLTWANKVHDPVTNAHGAPADYHGQISIDHLGTDGLPKMTYHFHKCWVKTVGEITLDYTSKEFTTFAVTFAYQYHTVNSIVGGQTAKPTGLGTGL